MAIYRKTGRVPEVVGVLISGARSRLQISVGVDKLTTILPLTNKVACRACVSGPLGGRQGIINPTQDEGGGGEHVSERTDVQYQSAGHHNTFKP